MISIIVPAYNSEEHLSQCLDSILGQSYRDFEVVVVNDGSTDRTGEIAEGYRAGDERVTVIHKQNEGTLRARSDGVAKSRGDYIMLVDSDDYLLPDILGTALENAVSCQAAVVCFNYRVKGRLGFEIRTVELMGAKEALREMMLCRKLDGNLWGKLYKKELFQQEGPLFSEVRNGCFLTTARLLQAADKIVLLPVCGYHYNIIDGSQSRGRHCHPREEDFYYSAARFTREIKAMYPDLAMAAEYFRLYTLMYVGLQMERDFSFPKTGRRYQRIKHKINQNSRLILANPYLGIKDKLRFCLVKVNLYRIMYKVYRKWA